MADGGYRIVKRDSLGSLERAVNRWTKQGWKPHGEMQIRTTALLLGSTYYVQPMVKKSQQKSQPLTKEQEEAVRKFLRRDGEESEKPPHSGSPVDPARGCTGLEYCNCIRCRNQ